MFRQKCINIATFSSKKCSLDFVTKAVLFTANPYFRRVWCWWNAHLCANLIIYYVSGTLFSRRRLWGGLKCVTVVKLTFSKPFFCFFIFLSIRFSGRPTCRKWGSRLCVVSLLESDADFWPPLGGVSGGRFYESKTFVLLMEFDVFS